ncbi:MAG: alcohol dehydrogenase catalytic domain-containing protein [Candidatus Brocadiaceae bacterium]|nr:alcohol dehydrogenase catalytic domain-containing protein [Candidatus Brocadiaceae bacterium]
MRALVLQSVGRLEPANVPRPVPADDQLLVRTRAAVICTSDLNDVRENPFGIRLPAAIGHEGAGTVESVGSQVKGFSPGDAVATHPVHPCRECENCRAGMGHLCSRMGHFGLNMPGTFAEYYVVRADRARRLPPDVDWAVAALAEPVSVCLEALAQARLATGARLLIIGDGPFGILIARLAAGLKPSCVVVAGRHDFRLGFAAGATTVNTRALGEDAAAALRAAAGGASGYDAVIAAAGSPEAVREGLSLLRPKGRLVLFSPVPGPVSLDLFDVHVRELEIVGACNDQDRFDEAVALLREPSLALGELVTHRLPMRDYREAFRLAERGREEAMKVAIIPEAEEA